MGHDLVIYQFSRAKVECGDFSHFVGIYAPEKLPTGRRLREMMNTLSDTICAVRNPRCAPTKFRVTP